MNTTKQMNGLVSLQDTNLTPVRLGIININEDGYVSDKYRKLGGEPWQKIYKQGEGN